MRITLGGDLGSGKSSVGRRLSERLGIPYVSAGKLFREIGQIANLDALATNLEAESNTDIDAQVDQRTRDLDRDLPDFIIDSRMGWHFVSNAVRVYLSVRAATAARRILADSTRDTESYPDLDSALVMLRRRRESEQKRYRTLYGADIEDRSNYDLWLITDDANIDDICEIVLAFVSERTRHRDWIPKARLVPLTGPPADCAKSSAVRFGPPDDFVLPVVVSDNFGLVFDASDSIAPALEYATALIPYRASSPASLPRSADPIDMARRLISEEQLNAWEACSGVRFSFREMLGASRKR
jgi:predicted cytidylate kinase